MSILPKQVRTLITEFSKLPGIGPKSAERLVFYLLKTKTNDLEFFGETLKKLKQNITKCDTCYNLTDKKTCVVCLDPKRDETKLCVVEEPLDVAALEKTREFTGLYHVLGGTISPLNGIGPDDLTVRQLLWRIEKNSQVREVILATNPSLEGEATAMFILRKLPKTHAKITRIARGIPVGGELEYADEITLSRALEDRSVIKK